MSASISTGISGEREKKFTRWQKKEKKQQSQNFQLKNNKRHIVHVIKMRSPQENYEILKNFYTAEGKVKDRRHTTRKGLQHM